MSQSKTMPRRKRLELRLLAGTSLGSMAAAVAVGLTPSAALAQQAPQSSADDSGASVREVVVTGYRRSLESSIQAKKKSDEIVEVVKAEDIGKLPDISIAESLARLPGVAAQRVDGRAQDISIRGMGPKYAVTLFNGNEMVSTGDDRSFQYDQFPAELVSSLTVYKTPDVTLGTQGLAGTVDIDTLKPLSVGHRVGTVTVLGETNSFGATVAGAQSAGNRISASYVDQFANGTIGVALGFAHLDSPVKHRYFDPWDYGTGSELGLNGAPNTYTYDGFEVGAQATKSIRDGFLGVLEYKPNDHFHSVLNLFHSQFSEKMEGPELNGGFPQWNSAPPPTIGISSTGAEVATGFYPIVTMRGDHRDDRVVALDFDNRYSVDGWTFRLDAAYSRATRREAVAEAYATPLNPMDMSIQWGNNSSFSQVNSAFNFGDPANWELSTAWGAPVGGVVSYANIHDEMKSLHLSAAKDLQFGPFTKVEAGIIYSDRTKSLVVNQYAYDLNSSTPCVMGTCSPIPNGLLLSPTNLGFAGVGNLINFNPFTALGSAAAYTMETSPATDPFFNWLVEEKITTGFLRTNFAFKALIPFHGNIGLQVVNTKQTSQSSYTNAQGNPQLASGGAEYTDVLPALNLIGDLPASSQLRFSVAKVVARPEMTLLRTGMNASVATGAGGNVWNGDTGNASLQPWRATDIDLSLSHYFGRNGYISLGAFDKEISTAIYTQTVPFNFSGYNLPTPVPASSNMGWATQPINTKGGWVRGVELSFAFELRALHPMLDGFGVNGSAANTSSNLPGNTTEGAPTDTHLDGLSTNVDDLTLYYQKNGFEARISERYRSDFTAVRHNAFRYVVDDIHGEALTDAQVSYAFDKGPLKGLNLLLQVENMFNTPYVTTQMIDNKVGLKEFHEYGATYLLGASYKF